MQTSETCQNFFFSSCLSLLSLKLDVVDINCSDIYMYIITGRTDGILSQHSCHITKLPVRKELKLLQNPQSMGLRGVPLNALESWICSIVSEEKCALHFPVPYDSGTPENHILSLGHMVYHNRHFSHFLYDEWWCLTCKVGWERGRVKKKLAWCRLLI